MSPLLLALLLQVSGPTCAVELKDEGATQGTVREINAVGTGILATVVGNTGILTVSAIGGGYSTIEEDDTPLTQRATLNFIGTSITCADNVTKTDCTLSGGGGAPIDAQYWTGAPDATLSAEKDLSALSTGLVVNTTGTPSAYGGTSCTNQFPRSLNASGAATCATVADADVENTITLDNLTQITTRAIADTTGTLAVSRGGTNLTASADDNVMLGNGTTWETKAIPDCGESGTLNYTASTNTFSCLTDSGGGGGLTLTTIEKDLGSTARFSGTFDITGLSGLTGGRPVLVSQAAGPYTGKGDREDEAEMDLATATGYVVDANTIRVYWTCQPHSGPLIGNVKFNYVVG